MRVEGECVADCVWCGVSCVLQVGNEFVVNLIPEGRERTILRRLARPFAPDEDRLAGIDTDNAPLTGAAILKVRTVHRQHSDRHTR